MALPKLPPLPRAADKGTTAVGFISDRGNKVIRNTGIPGTDHNQLVYELECAVGHRFGANGSDIHLRVCPYCNTDAQGADLLVAQRKVR